MDLIKMLAFHAFTVSPKSAAASHGELLAGRLLFSPGTRYLIISRCRSSGRGQQSATAAVHVYLHLRSKELLPNVPVTTNWAITPSLSLPLSTCVSTDTKTDWNDSWPNALGMIWVSSVLLWLNYLKTAFAPSCRGESSAFQLQHAFGFQ